MQHSLLFFFGHAAGKRGDKSCVAIAPGLEMHQLLLDSPCLMQAQPDARLNCFVTSQGSVSTDCVTSCDTLRLCST